MFFSPRFTATSRRFATIARDRVARENDCREAAFPRIVKLGKVIIHTQMARALNFPFSLSLSPRCYMSSNHCSLFGWRLQKQVETFPGRENSPLRYGLNSVVHAARVYIILNASYISHSREDNWPSPLRNEPPRAIILRRDMPRVQVPTPLSRGCLAWQVGETEGRLRAR